MRNKKGFTLVEVLLVIVIIAILAAIVIVAINPGRQISQANNTQRQSDIKTLLDAVHEYAIDNRGTFPAAIPSGTAVDALTIASGEANADICADLVSDYIAAMPFDPTDADGAYTDCAAYDTGYTIFQDADSGRITVSAPNAENDATITVTR
jgi:type IV pilus assembly protein PilA